MNQPEPTLADIAREYSQWEAWRGISGLLYARLRNSSPPVTVQGEDPLDLRDEIRRAESKLAGRHAGEEVPGPGDSTAGP